MTGVTQDFIHLHSRVDNINDRMTVLLKGIVYLVSLRWVFSRLRHNSAPGSAPAEDLAPAEAPAVGCDVVNEVMSLERPFSFESAISTQNVTTEAVATAVSQTQTEAAATYEIYTKNFVDEMESDRILAVVNTAVEENGLNSVLQRW